MFGKTKKKKVDSETPGLKNAEGKNPEDKSKGDKKKRLSGISRDLMNDMRYGRSLSLEFFRQNAWLLMLFVVAIIALMGLRYKTKTKMEEIKSLNVELQRAQSNKLQEKAAYMSLIREAEMKKLVDEKGLGLQFQEYPPYELKIEENK